MLAIIASMVAVLAGVCMATRHTFLQRAWAKQAWNWAEGYLAAEYGEYTEAEALETATVYYMDKHPGVFSDKRYCKDAIKRWVLEHPDPLDVRDAHRPGRKEFMTDEECRQCIEELSKGYYRDHQFYFFTSLTQAANSGGCPTVARCRWRYSRYNESGMWLRLKAFDKHLIRFKPRVIKPMSPRLRAERVAASSYLYDMGLDYAKRTFAIDEKTIVIHPKGGSCIGYIDEDNNFIIECDDIKWRNAMTHREEFVKVGFYSMINFWVGPCGFYPSQISTGLPQQYKVSYQLSLKNTCALPSLLLLHAFKASLRAACQLAWLWSSSNRTTL